MDAAKLSGFDSFGVPTLTMLPHLFTWQGLSDDEQSEILPYILIAHSIVTNNRLSKASK